MIRLKKYIKRDRSVITNKKDLKRLYTFKDFPVFFGCVDTPKSKDIVADMEWCIDPDTGVIQLSKLIPLNILYQSQHVDGYGPTWQKYYEEFAKYICEKRVKSVLEIGGGSGQLANIALNLNKDLKWTIVEPNPWCKNHDRLKVIKSFFDKDFHLDSEIDTIVFSHVLEHAYNPNEFVSLIARCLKKGNKVIFGYPQLDVWLKKKYTNAINFEHTIFLTDYFVDYLLSKNGFIVKDKTIYNEHSFLYLAEYDPDNSKVMKYKNMGAKYKKIFMDFVNYHKKMVKELNNKMKKAKEPVYLFGAHIFSTFLLAFGLKTNKIVTILDNSPTKNKKRLYGTDFIVESPKILKDKGKVNLILKAGVHTDDIKKDILENINPDVVFW